jgi:dipeptidyl aminopeptidase/acylaminoacyl peptidase
VIGRNRSAGGVAESRGARPPRAGDPYGLGPAGTMLAPALSVVGLALIAWLSVSLLTGNLPFGLGSGRGGPGGAVGAEKTPTPPNVVIVPSAPPEARLAGLIVYAKQGNLWVEDAAGARQITDTRRDSMPSFSRDGNWIYFIETRRDSGLFSLRGKPYRTYTLAYPLLMRVHPDGSGRERLTSGLYHSGQNTWFYWLRQPVLSPNGRTVALLSDGPDPTNSNVVLQFFDLKSKKLTKAGVPEFPPLGHQDPAWSPDGATLLYVKNGRSGSRGAPQIYRYVVATKKTRALTGPGYNSPRFSPDGRYVVATKTSNLGTDVVILDARNGAEIVRVTDDSHSWAGAWSPAGDGIVFLHIEGGVTDVQFVKLSGPSGRWTVGKAVPLTENAGLDGASHPDWFIPADQLPRPSPTPAGTPAPSAS